MIELEERFLPPDTWTTDRFHSGNRTIRYGFAAPAQSKATILCLQGLSEFIEKYYETARWALGHDYAFYTFDWAGQGGSGRYLDNPHKRHSEGFDTDLKDLHAFITKYVPDDKPLILLAHSTGAHLGLRYMQDHPDAFICAGLTSPLIGVAGAHWLPFPVIQAIAGGLNAVAGQSYVPGGRDWTPETRKNAGQDQFSSDPVRGAVHNAWCLHNPALQIGSPTCGWLSDAISSIAALKKGNTIHTHCLIGLAGDDQIVDNRAIKKFAAHVPHARLLDLAGAQHEIFMERDSIRGMFLERVQKLIEHVLPAQALPLQPEEETGNL